MNTISEEQVLHNELSFEINQELIHLMKRIIEIQKQNTDLKDNWNKLKEWLVQLQKFKGINQQGFSWGVAQEVLDKMQEIEGGRNEYSREI